ncbi:MAG: VIT1/CCC1 transporter family protein [Rubripirellula sp.]
MKAPNASIANDSPTLEHSHSPAEIAARIAAPNSHSYLRDGIYGAIDGAVTTFAVVSGVAGAGLSPTIVIVLGIANLIGDGFSMAAGNFLGTRAENQELEKVRSIEQKHIRECPEGEREEIRQILTKQGFSGDLLERAVEQITANETTWVEAMLQNEYGLSIDQRGALPAAAMTLGSFIVVGGIPLSPFVLNWIFELDFDPFPFSAALTAVAFFLVGAVKSRFVQQRWWLAGCETLTVGAIAAGLAYGCGHLLGSIAR